MTPRRRGPSGSGTCDENSTSRACTRKTSQTHSAIRPATDQSEEAARPCRAAASEIETETPQTIAARASQRRVVSCDRHVATVSSVRVALESALWTRAKMPFARTETEVRKVQRNTKPSCISPALLTRETRRPASFLDSVAYCWVPVPAGEEHDVRRVALCTVYITKTGKRIFETDLAGLVGRKGLGHRIVDGVNLLGLTTCGCKITVHSDLYHWYLDKIV